MKLFIDGKPVAIIKLNDIYEFQMVDFREIKLNRKKNTQIKLEILEVYPGSKFQDTAISELEFYGGGIY